MSGIQQWAFSICATCVICGIVTVLFPTGGTAKLVKMFAGAMFLIVVVSPFASLNSSTILYQSHNAENYDLAQESEKLAQELVIQLWGENVKEVVQGELAKIDVVAKKISIKINTMDDNSIFISKVIIHLEEQYQSIAQNIQTQLEDVLKLKVVLEYQ